ncbi:hypothetical protein RIF29_15261 [Crotalaria pallida]|uniref:Uncharacterized protein n=1 Tax=Crotalaria pallida TaxID=3830 RepID=A0AAN9FCU5_CROPI
MAKKRGRPPKTNPTTPLSSSRKDPPVTKDNEERNLISFALLDAEGIKTDALDDLDDQQTKALITNIDRLLLEENLNNIQLHSIMREGIQNEVNAAVIEDSDEQ